MNKKGFTLIELLAVIVILAIIALIATPIVLNIIEDSKKSAFVQTGNGIVDAAEYYYMKEMSDGAKPTESKVFTFNGTTTGLEGLEFDGEIPKEGKLTIDVNGKVELVAHNNQYCITKGYEENGVTIKDYDGNCKVIYINGITSSENICIQTGSCEKGTPVSVKVNDTQTYNFYVLSFNENGTTNLIMDRNICEDGTEATSTNTCSVKWQESGSNTDGPVTAMNYLYNATKDWTNIDPVNYTYMDRVMQGITEENIGYTLFVSTNGIAVVTPLIGDDVPIGTSTDPLRARMPIYSSDTTKTEVADSNGSNEYLYENLSSKYWYGTGPLPTNNIENIYAYWTLSSYPYDSHTARIVGYSGRMGSNIDDANKYGVRPVITLKI